LEQQKRRPWRRWVVLVIMIVGFVLGGVSAPVQPEITVAPERLIEMPLTEDFLWLGALTHGKFSLGPLYFVNTMTTLIVTILLLIGIAYFTNRSLKRSEQTDLVPRGIGNLMESFFELLYNLTESSAGAKWAKAIFPWFATIMIYVLFANLLKLLPGFESIGVFHSAHGEGYLTKELGTFLGYRWEFLTADKVEQGGKILAPWFRGVSVDLNFTFALAIISVVMTQVIGFRAQRLGYFSKFFNTRRMFKVPFFGAMDFLVGFLELISELAKVISFSFRLFFNMFAGLILVVVVAFLLGKFTILTSMLYLFELFVAVIQAFVFGMLTMVFMAQATQSHSEEHAEAH
jgi:F-type H+-transporting ATPase subunit a